MLYAAWRRLVLIAVIIRLMIGNKALRLTHCTNTYDPSTTGNVSIRGVILQTALVSSHTFHPMRS